MISPRGEDGNWSMTIFRILISIESRRNIKSRRGIDESRSPNFPTIRKRFGGGRPTNVAESIVRHSRIGLAEVAVSAPAFRGTGVSVESLFGPFLLVHAPQHEAQSLFRSRTRGLPFSPFLSLSPLLVPLLSSYRAVRLSIFMSICFRRVLEPNTAKNRHPSLALISLSHRDILPSLLSSSFRLRFLNLRKKEEWTDKDFLLRENYTLLLCYSSRCMQYIRCIG